MSEYRHHITLIRSLCEGTEAFYGLLQGIAQSEEADLVRFIRKNHLGPWLNPILDDEPANKVLPSSFLDELRKIRPNNEARTASLISQTHELQRGLLDREIAALFFKGIVLGSEVYGDVYRRHQLDVDVMVDRSNLRAVVALLDELGYDTQFDSSTGEVLQARVSRMLEAPYAKNDTACSLERGRQKLDLHCSLRVRYEDSVDFRSLIGDSKDVTIEGVALRVPTLESTMMIQLILIADELRRSTCKAKLFLDFYVLCRGLGPDWSWETFFEARRGQWLEKLSVNVCALFLDLWDCAEEFPELAAAIDRRARMLEISSSAEADAIIARPRHDRANRLLIKRIYRGGTAGKVARRFAKDLPHAAARIAGLRRSEYRFSSER